MFINKDRLLSELRNAYTYIIVPKGMLDVAVEDERFKLDDGSYGTLNQLGKELGKAFTPVPAIDERFMKFRWLLVANKDAENALKEFMKASDIVDMFDGVSDVSEIKFYELNGNEFGIFDAFSIKQVPKLKQGDEY
jgi:predicted hydrocarbon binding protein